MSIKLIETLEAAISNLAQEARDTFMHDASVLVQFAAGDWEKIKEALKGARTELDAKLQHNVADAAGVVSHMSGGEPIPVATRLDMIEPAKVEAAVAAAQPAQSTPENTAGPAQP